MSIDLIGYRVLGRHGELGTVVETNGIEAHEHDASLVVRGGSTDRLVFHLPVTRITEVRPRRRLVLSEVDVTDFEPSLNEDGDIDLRLSS